MKSALFLNGVYESVIEDIIFSQDARGGGTHHLQPYKGSIIKMLKKAPPSDHEPVSLYVSTTKNRNNICYTAKIVGWKDKRDLSLAERGEVLEHLIRHQPGEKPLFVAEKEVGEKAVNLLTLKDVQRCINILPTSVLKKRSDNLHLKPRTRAGGWSEVFDVGDILLLPTEQIQDYEADLNLGIRRSMESNEAERKKRLASAERMPMRIQLLSMGFKRNPDVISEVLQRAAGVCEKCKQPAPFLRRSNSTPYLEVHHWKPLSDGGEDTVENAGALCPNCHRQVHLG
jgi:hypothetical protein